MQICGDRVHFWNCKDSIKPDVHSWMFYTFYLDIHFLCYYTIKYLRRLKGFDWKFSVVLLDSVKGLHRQAAFQCITDVTWSVLCSWKKEQRSLRIGGWKKRGRKRRRKWSMNSYTDKVQTGLMAVNWRRRYWKSWLTAHKFDSSCFQILHLFAASG